MKRPLLGTVALAMSLACGSGGDATKPDGDGSPGGLPDALIATWHLEQAGDPVCDPDTGECTTSFARSETLELASNGTFEHALFAESNFPPCSLTAHHESSGTAEADATTLQLHIETGLTHVEDTCGESGDTDESGKTDTYTYEITDGAPQLTLTDEEGNEIGPFEAQ